MKKQYVVDVEFTVFKHKFEADTDLNQDQFLNALFDSLPAENIPKDYGMVGFKVFEKSSSGKYARVQHPGSTPWNCEDTRKCEEAWK